MAGVNRFFKSSFSVLTIVAIVSVLIWGWTAFLVVLIAVPLVGWARYSLKQHSPTQLAAGVGLALAVITATFYFFGLYWV